MDEASLELRQTYLVKFGELVASLRLDYEERFWPTLHKLVGIGRRCPDEPKARRNQST